MLCVLLYRTKVGESRKMCSESSSSADVGGERYEQLAVSDENSDIITQRTITAVDIATIEWNRNFLSSRYLFFFLSIFHYFSLVLFILLRRHVSTYVV